jgi:hypothetical protein
MAEGTQTLLVGVAGITATLIASGLGLYFTANARTAPLRHLLYEKQLNLVTTLMELVGKMRNYSTILGDPSSEFVDRARQDLGDAVPRLSTLVDTSAAILPTEVFAEVANLRASITSFLHDFDKGEIDSTFSDRLGVQAAKMALVARASLGIDELSSESIKLFGSTAVFQRLSAVTEDDIRASVNARSQKAPSQVVKTARGNDTTT